MSSIAKSITDLTSLNVQIMSTNQDRLVLNQAVGKQHVPQ